eukprot:643157-Hanusia_phi.AAC.5
MEGPGEELADAERSRPFGSRRTERPGDSRASGEPVDRRRALTTRAVTSNSTTRRALRRRWASREPRTQQRRMRGEWGGRGSIDVDDVRQVMGRILRVDYAMVGVRGAKSR